MIIFHFVSAASSEMVDQKTEALLAQERHNPFSFWESFYNARKGLYIYRKPFGFIGYYEDGSRSRTDALLPTKTWFFVKTFINSTKKAKGVVLFSPAISFFLFFSFAGSLIFGLCGHVESFILTLLSGVLFFDSLRSERIAYALIQKLFDEQA